MGSEWTVWPAWGGHLRQQLMLLLLFMLLPCAVGGDSCERGALLVVGPPPSVEALEGDDVTLACLYNVSTERGGLLDVEWTYSPHHVDILDADHVLVAVYANGRVHHGASVLPSPLAGHVAFARPGALGEAAGDAALLVTGASRHHAGRFVCRVRALPCNSQRRGTWLVVRAVKSHVVLVAMVTSSLGVLALVMLALWLRARRSRDRRGHPGVSREEAELCAVTPTEVARTRGWWKELDSQGVSTQATWSRVHDSDDDSDAHNPFSLRDGESDREHRSRSSQRDDDSSGSHNPFSPRHADSDGAWGHPHDPDDRDGAGSPSPERDDSDHDSRNPFSDREVEEGEVDEGEVLDITNPFSIPEEPEATSSFGSIEEVMLTKSSGHEPWNPFEDGDTDDDGDGSEDMRP